MMNLLKIALARLGLYPASAELFVAPLRAMAEDLRAYEQRQHDASVSLNYKAQEATNERNRASGLAAKMEEILK